MSFQLVSKQGLSLLGFTPLRVKMSAKGLVLNHKFIFDGTNYDVWKIHMLNHFRVLDPNIERILDMGFSSPMEPQNLSLEEKTNSYLDAHVSKVLCLIVSYVVMCSVMPCQNAHEIWTKLQDKYDVSNIVEDDCIASTSGHDEFSSPSTSPKCGKT